MMYPVVFYGKKGIKLSIEVPIKENKHLQRKR